MTLKFITWNVQHGSASLIQTPNGKRIAVDLGAGEEFSPLRYIKYDLGIDQLDEVIITHPHMDHIEDMLNFDLLNPRVLNRPRHLSAADISIGNPSAGSEADKVYQKYLEVDAKYIFPVPPTENPLEPTNNGEVSIKTFHPTGSPKTNLNNHSIVSLIEYEGVKILSPGDNESLSWEELLADTAFKDAIRGTHVLVAPHHGRESGYHGELFDHISPLITIISDGRALDTNASSRYSAKSKGWNVKKGDGTYHERKCLTTRNDGTILTTIAPSTSGIGSLEVLID